VAPGQDPEHALRDGDLRSPTAAEIAMARSAIQTAVAAVARREEPGRTLVDAERDLAAARDELAGCAEVADPRPAAALVDEALGISDVEATAPAARLPAESASRAAGEAVARPPGWERGGDALASRPSPDHATVAARTRARPDDQLMAFAVVHAPAFFRPRARGRGAAGHMLGPNL